MAPRDHESARESAMSLVRDIFLKNSPILRILSHDDCDTSLYGVRVTRREYQSLW